MEKKVSISAKPSGMSQASFLGISAFLLVRGTCGPCPSRMLHLPRSQRTVGNILLLRLWWIEPSSLRQPSGWHEMVLRKEDPAYSV